MVRIYNTEVQNWKVATGASGMIGIALLLSYLSAAGYIEVSAYSGDMFCLGTPESPCYGYVNLTAKEDLSIYLKDFNPDGNASLFFFEPGVPYWRLQYKSGSSWKDYTLNSAISWKKGSSYQLRVVAYKRSPSDRIKWSAFNGLVDPVWYGPNDTNYTTVETCVPINQTRSYTQNLSRVITTNGTPATWQENYTSPASYLLEVQSCSELGIEVAGVLHPYIQADKQCLRTDNILCCWRYDDGGALRNRGGIYRTSIDSGEKGICVDLAANLTVLSRQGEVSFP